MSPVDRRWAEARGMPRHFGHRYGAKKIEKFLKWCLKLNIPQISLYTLSTENLNRSDEEVKELFRLAKEFYKKWEKDTSILDKYEVKVRFCGDFKRLPPSLVKIMKKIMKKTAKYQKKVLNILIAYGSHFELTKAVKKIAEKAIKSGRIEVTRKDIEKNLLVPTPVDMIIRTGGYSRLSNFLLWQSAYADMYITKTLWPDFSRSELIKAIKWYNTIQRKFGR